MELCFLTFSKIWGKGKLDFFDNKCLTADSLIFFNIFNIPANLRLN